MSYTTKHQSEMLRKALQDHPPPADYPKSCPGEDLADMIKRRQIELGADPASYDDPLPFQYPSIRWVFMTLGAGMLILFALSKLAELLR
jgi:hypothetical protein